MQFARLGTVACREERVWSVVSESLAPLLRPFGHGLLHWTFQSFNSHRSNIILLIWCQMVVNCTSCVLAAGGGSVHSHLCSASQEGGENHSHPYGARRSQHRRQRGAALSPRWTCASSWNVNKPSMSFPVRAGTLRRLLLQFSLFESETCQSSHSATLFCSELE